MNRLFGPIPPAALHLVVDMQELFRSHPDWGTLALNDIIPPIQRLLTARPDSAYFSRFIPAQNPDQAKGAWRQYYRRWSSATLDRIDPALVDVIPELRPWAKRVGDKHGYSAMAIPELRNAAVEASGNCVIVSGVETDVCVLATVIDAIEVGLRVVLVSDALASSVEASHAKALEILHDRFDQQVELATADQVLAAWQK